MVSGHDIKERRNNMSFNYVFMNEDFAVIGSDSRETFINGTYNDNRQKTFVNRKLHLCWSITGITKLNGIDFIEIINTVMSMDAHIIAKLNFIKSLMCSQTEQYNIQYNKEAIFDLFVLLYNEQNIEFYVLEVKDGKANEVANKKYINIKKHIKEETSGIRTDIINTINYQKLHQYPVMTVNQLIKDVIEESQYKDKTVGGATYIALMDKHGKITTYINGQEKEF